MQATWCGEKLKVRRKALGLTLEQVAEKIGAAKPHVSMWENNKSVPGGEYLVVLVTVLKSKVLDFFNVEEK